MERSTEIMKIGAALMVFHDAVQKITKDAKNPAFKRGNNVSKYASLSNIQDAIAHPLKEAGLVYTQLPDMDNTLVTLLMHPASGEYLQATYSMNPISTTPQATGSAITYAKRYALVAILGLNIDEDDDGNAASGVDANKAQAPTQPATTSPQPKKNGLIDLVPNTPNWDKVKKYISDNKEWTMQELEKKYNISQPVKKQLIELSLQTA